MQIIPLNLDSVLLFLHNSNLAYNTPLGPITITNDNNNNNNNNNNDSDSNSNSNSNNNNNNNNNNNDYNNEYHYRFPNVENQSSKNHVFKVTH